MAIPSGSKNVGRESRFAYCKNSDVVAELQQFGPKLTEIPEGGGFHYVATFLQWIDGQPALLISYQPTSGKAALGNVEAQVLTRGQPFGMPSLLPLSELIVFVKTFFKLLAYRPNKIFCAASGGPLWACYVISRLYSAKFVCTRHSSVEPDLSYATGGFWSGINKKVLKKAAAVMCHGPFLQDELLRIGVSKERLIQFNLSYKYLLALPRDHQDVRDFTEQGRYRTVLCVGRVRKDKGVFDLLNAMAPLLQQEPGLRLIFAGSGPAFPALQDAVADSASKDQVFLMGHVEHHLLPTLIQQCAFVVAPTHPSSTEARPKTVIEAMVIGRPVIAPSFGPFPYLIKDRSNGLLFKPGSAESLRSQVAALLQDQSLYKTVLHGAQSSSDTFLSSSCGYRQALERAFGAA